MADVGGKQGGEPPHQGKDDKDIAIPEEAVRQEFHVKEPAEREEVRFFREQYFAGKTREEIEALLKTSDNPDFQRAGQKSLAALESSNTAKAVDGLTVEVATDAMATLKRARKPARLAAKKGELFEIAIADEKIKDPERAYETFLQAIALAKKQLPGFLKVRIENIKFQKLAGEIVGKSTEDGITIDPIMLLHPVMRLATVIFHEALHADNQIPNEGLVQTQAEMYFGGMKTPSEYDTAVNKFTKFANIYGKGNIEKASKEIYRFYYKASKGNKPIYYLVMYNRFAKKARNTASFPTEESIKQFFFEVFPELKKIEFEVD